MTTGRGISLSTFSGIQKPLLRLLVHTPDAPDFVRYHFPISRGEFGLATLLEFDIYLHAVESACKAGMTDYEFFIRYPNQIKPALKPVMPTERI